MWSDLYWENKIVIWVHFRESSGSLMGGWSGKVIEWGAGRYFYS